ncbi:hypothetical protein [Mycobacterium sp. P7213]|uniref:hypothetical protein n=1 Tax=Mycobacterium sp. P7213 TaxID=2478465 RepID=UPI000F6441A7|nr:hypothetical protein [Mycobacterium sp. P7213]
MAYKSDDSDFGDILGIAAVAAAAVAGIGGALAFAGKALYDYFSDSSDESPRDPSASQERRAGSGSADEMVVDFEGRTWPSSGVLKQMGYRVGRSGHGPARRRSILEKVYRVKLVATSTHTAEYIREWGEPNTRARAEKIERCLAGFISGARRRNADMSEAIGDWEDDLVWLRNHYRL